MPAEATDGKKEGPPVSINLDMKNMIARNLSSNQGVEQTYKIIITPSREIAPLSMRWDCSEGSTRRNPQTMNRSCRGNTNGNLRTIRPKSI